MVKGEWLPRRERGLPVPCNDFISGNEKREQGPTTEGSPFAKGLRPQARFGAQPAKPALSAEMSCREATEGIPPVISYLFTIHSYLFTSPRPPYG